MKLEQANTQMGITFPINEFEESDIVGFVADPTKLSRITDAVNADRRQKIALVEARYDLSARIGDGDADEKIEGLGFKRLTRDITKDGETITVPDETEGAHIKRFVDALATGAFTTPNFTLPSGDANVKEKAAVAFLQVLANERTYTLNLDKAVRTGTGGLVPQWAKDGAGNIIKNGSQSSWATKFTTGYTTASGVAITPFVFGNFQQVAAEGSTAEQVQAVADSNIKNLAKALVEQRRQENAARSGEFA